MKSSLSSQIPQAKPYLSMSFTGLAASAAKEKDPQVKEIKLLVLREKSHLYRLKACRRSGLSAEDLDDGESMTFAKMLNILDRYNPNASQFQTFAFRHMQAAARGCREEDALIRRPPSHYEDASRIYRFVMQWESQRGTPFVIEDNEALLAKKLGFTIDRLRNAIAVNGGIRSLDAPHPINGRTIAENTGVDGPEPYEQEGDDRAYFMRAALRGLSSREISILTARFGLNGGEQMTLQEIGKAMSLTRERVRQIQAQALKKLRQSIERMELSPELRDSTLARLGLAAQEAETSQVVEEEEALAA
jgi:RNA polymerase sigma factor (sigma-70 family)